MKYGITLDYHGLNKHCLIVQPCELACYSRAEGGDISFDDHCLVIPKSFTQFLYHLILYDGSLFVLIIIFKRLLRNLVAEDIGTDLNQGFDTFTEKRGKAFV